jgi:thiol:disulfide interchange protein DsbA
MKRLAAWLLGLWLVPMLSIALEEGFDYQHIIPSVPTQNQASDRVEVVEMFWYGCPHCYHFEPILTKWADQKPENVDFIRVPAVFRDSWLPLARAFYTAEILGVLDRLHEDLFKAVQEQHRKLNDINAIRDFFAEHGVSAEDFDRVFNSFGVEARIRRAKDLTRRYGIDGVPSVIINGKYRTSGTLTGGLDKVPPVIDALIQKELAPPSPTSSVPSP